MRLLHTPGAVEAVFDDQRLISYAGLEPVMRLAEQCGLRQRVRQKVRLPGPVGANPGGKVATIVGLGRVYRSPDRWCAHPER